MRKSCVLNLIAILVDRPMLVRPLRWPKRAIFHTRIVECTHLVLSIRVKDNIIESFKIHKSDTGSSVVQIALLTKEIEYLTQHLRTHKKDFSSRRGLIKKVSQRRRLLKFLRQDDAKQFEKIIKELKLRRPAEVTAVEDDIKQEEEQSLLEVTPEVESIKEELKP
mgnify:CR=1 FL=1